MVSVGRSDLVILNLAINADPIPGGGIMVIQTDNRLRGRRNCPRATTWWFDFGTGMTPEVLANAEQSMAELVVPELSSSLS